MRRNKAEPDTMASTQARTRDFCEGAGRGKGTGMVSARARRRTNGQHYQGLPVRSDHTSLFTSTNPLQQNCCTVLCCISSVGQVRTAVKTFAAHAPRYPRQSPSQSQFLCVFLLLVFVCTVDVLALLEVLYIVLYQHGAHGARGALQRRHHELHEF